MNAILSYFQNDPLKLLYLLGGAGGIWFWVEKWLDRVRIRVRLLSHSFDIKQDDIEVRIEFEVVNLGKSPTSLKPTINCNGYEINRKREAAILAVLADERLLPPHSTKRFTAVGRAPTTYSFWVFKRFKISPSRGRSSVLRARMSPSKQINWLQYDLELTIFRWTGYLPFVHPLKDD